MRLQCYEGLDVASAVYEWNYQRQMLEIRLAEAAGTTERASLSGNIFSERSGPAAHCCRRWKPTSPARPCC